jgi:hypothetical protein
LPAEALNQIPDLPALEGAWRMQAARALHTS